METEFFLLDVDYVDQGIEVEGEEIKGSVIRLFGRTESGETVLAIDRGFRPYFYAVPNTDPQKVKERVDELGMEDIKISDVEVVERLVESEAERKEVLKIYGYHPSDLKKIRDRVKKIEGVGKGNCYSFSMNFYRQYLIDKNLKPGSSVKVSGEELEDDDCRLKVEVNKVETAESKEEKETFETMAFDVETYEDSGTREIVMISVASEDFKKVITYQEGDYPDQVEVMDNERKLIDRFVELVHERDPDIILTYNGDDYDFNLLRERSEELDVGLTLGRDGSKMKFVRRTHSSSARIPGRVHIDLYRFVDEILSRQLETEVLSLNEVSEELLGEGKVDMQFEEMLRKWEEGQDLDRLAEYSLKDAELTFDLGGELVPQIKALSRVVGQTPFDVSRMSYGQLVEWFLLWKAHPERIPPNRPKHGEIQERRKRSPFKGGFVKEPEPGLHEKVTVLDFKSLYPTIIVSYNISPETMDVEGCEDEEGVPGMEVKFCQDKEGFIPSVLGDLIEERTKLKEKLEELEEDGAKYKNLDNRQYALKVLANSVYGYYGYVGARWYSRDCARAITSLGRDWIKEVMEAAKEDGFEVLYGDTDSLMVKGGDAEEFLEEINNELPGIMRLELEGVFERGLFVRKEKGKGAKKRYALADKDGNLRIRGFETVRKDWCSLAKKTQREILKKVLIENSIDDAVEYTQKVVEDLKKTNVDLGELVIYTQLTKPTNEYKSRGPHVHAAMKLEEGGVDVKPGTTIMYIISEGSGSVSERAMPLEMASTGDIDSGYYIDRQIVPAAMRVLDVLGVDEEEVKDEGKQESLEDF